MTGRAEAQDDLSPAEYEEVFEFLYRTSLRAPFDIKTTEAQHYRRYVARQAKSLPAPRGGSRSRAYALTGNFLAADPSCVYQPGETAPTARH